MATDSSGNQAVAFEWGNLPMQPNNDRTDSWNYGKHIPPKLGAGDSHAISGSIWNNYPGNNYGTEGRVLAIEDGGFFWPSVGICYNNPANQDGRWQDLIEYMRTCGVNPSRLREATFVGGDNKYDTSGDYDGGIIFWDYIPASEIISIDWERGHVLTGKDFNGFVVSSNHSAGDEVPVDPESDLDISFTVFTNDPNKNTASWWY